ncbi:hypothetical protein SCOR_07685 [Sulfidibacter corallicola]|uniref:NHL repeat-containing protein n=1 Tax=Sulfidibacter corallicola TaxID=2818388 RepID=A0A8A4TN13_SULCO|nr:NHL repeat-containing protein [Sulfidibacter corallicola]QTD51356.1 hypothetical protein J3U87_02710 [Sulfidibacter corallicola]
METDVHLIIVTFDPSAGERIPVPQARVRVFHDGSFGNPEISGGAHTTDAQGLVTVPITHEEGGEGDLIPYFEIELDEADRSLGTQRGADLVLPAIWATTHHYGDPVPLIAEHADPANPFVIHIGLEAELRLSYADFHPSGLRNPMALPEDCGRLRLVDVDSPGVFQIFNPDDGLSGFGRDGLGQVIEVGDVDGALPFFDEWPTTYHAWDSIAVGSIAIDDLAPIVDPPGLPVGNLGGGSYGQVGPLGSHHEGFVLLCDDNQVHRFYPDGTYFETLGDPRNQNFVQPAGLAPDGHGNVFLSDRGGNFLSIYVPQMRYNPLGGLFSIDSVVSVMGTGGFILSQPAGMAVLPHPDLEGTELLLVANSGLGEILVFEVVITSAVPKARLFAESPRVELHFKTRFGSQGNGPDQFQQPLDVAVDAANNIWVADPGLNRVSHWTYDRANDSFDPQGLVGKPDFSAGSGSGEFDQPVAVVVDVTRHFLYVADKDNHRIVRLDSRSGTELKTWIPQIDGADVTPVGLAMDPRGRITVADENAGRVLHAEVFDADGSARTGADDPRPLGEPWHDRTHPTHMQAPAYVMLDGEQRLWVSDTGNRRVLRFSRNANRVLELEAGATLTHPDLRTPVGLALASDGTLCVADRDRHVVRLFQGGAPTVLIGVDGTSGNDDAHLDGPHGLAIRNDDAGEALYIADTENNRIQVFSLAGVFQKTLDPPPQTFERPHDLVFDDAGFLYITNTLQQEIVRYDASDAYLGAIRLDQFSETLQHPIGISVDHDQRLLVTDSTQAKVYRLTPDHQVGATESLTAYWDFENLLNQDLEDRRIYNRDLELQVRPHLPSRAVVDAEGLLAIADTGRHRVRLMRTCTRWVGNFFEIGRHTGVDNLPDLEVRLETVVTWPELEVTVQVGDVSIFDETQTYTSPESSEFLGDRYTHEAIISGDRTAEAINVLRVVREFQTWLRALTAEANPFHWGHHVSNRLYVFDMITHLVNPGSYYFMDVNLDDDGRGRGGDGWDNGNTVHEVGHHVVAKADGSHPPLSIIGLIQIGGSHSRRQIHNQTKVFSEGFASFFQASWGSEYGMMHRQRGYFARPAFSTQDLDELEEDDREVFLYGGPFTSPVPIFDEPGQGLFSEGYLTNMLYQFQNLLINPGIGFADNPAFWHYFNVPFSEEASRRFVDFFWRPFRMWPSDEWDDLSRFYLTSLLRSVKDNQPGFLQMVYAFFELHNMLMPRMAVTHEEEDDELDDWDSVDVAADGAAILAIRLTDIHGDPLENYAIRLSCNDDINRFTVLSNPVPPSARGRIDPNPGPPDRETLTQTDGSGNLRVRFRPDQVPAPISEEILTIEYQPDFERDQIFSPPEPTDTREITLRRLFLHQARLFCKSWRTAGTTIGNWGAHIRHRVPFEVES